MKHLSSLFIGLAKSLHRSSSRKAANRSLTDADDAASVGGRGGDVVDSTGAGSNKKKQGDSDHSNRSRKDLVLRSSGSVRGESSGCLVSVYSRRGEKGINQDCAIVWEEFGCQPDTIFCGIFDGHGAWGHYVAKRVRESLPSSLLCTWQEAVSSSSSTTSSSSDPEELLSQLQRSSPDGAKAAPGTRFELWRQSYLASCAAVDNELKANRGLDAFYSGTTALTLVKQGDLLVVANVGDSRAVLATLDEDGTLMPVQLTVDFKPSVPQEAERILQCKGRVFCLDDEPGLHRLWLPYEETPGLAMSRAFGDHCVKDFGLISVPEITQRSLTSKDQFVVLATDGVWDVVSNQEAVRIVSSTPDRSKAAKRLVEYATRAWRKRRPGIALDDCSAVCVFLPSSSSTELD